MLEHLLSLEASRLNLSLLKSIDIGISKSDDAYNSRNLLTPEIQTLPGLYPATVRYGYDADGLRSGLQGGTGGSPVSYSCTARAQFQNVIADPAPLATYTDDKAGRNTTLLHENSLTESKTYAAASQLFANTHLNGRNSKGKFKRTEK